MRFGGLRGEDLVLFCDQDEVRGQCVALLLLLLCGARAATCAAACGLAQRPDRGLSILWLSVARAGPLRPHYGLAHAAAQVAGTLPHYVALDHARREVIVAVRGTMSIADTVTDCLWQPAEITAEVTEAAAAGEWHSVPPPWAGGAWPCRTHGNQPPCPPAGAPAVGAADAAAEVTVGVAKIVASEVSGAAGMLEGQVQGVVVGPGQPHMHRGSGLASPQVRAGTAVPGSLRLLLCCLASVLHLCVMAHILTHIIHGTRRM